MKNFEQGKKIIKNIIQFLPNGPGYYYNCRNYMRTFNGLTHY